MNSVISGWYKVTLPHLLTLRGSSPFRSQTTLWELNRQRDKNVISKGSMTRPKSITQGVSQDYFCVPDAFLGISPKWDHLVDLQSPCCVSSPSPCLKGPVLHFRQEVFREGAAHIIFIPILKYTSTTEITHKIWPCSGLLINRKEIW